MRNNIRRRRYICKLYEGDKRSYVVKWTVIQQRFLTASLMTNCLLDIEGVRGVTVLQCLSTQAFLRCKTAGVTAQHHGLNLEGVQC